MTNTNVNDSASGFFQAGIDPVSSLISGGKNVKLGLCFSGGGSRALTCALGQLSGLRTLPHPDDAAKSFLDRVDYLSSVSGGTWASVLYTFMPETINGRAITDDDILIKPIDPKDLIKDEESKANPANVSYMAPFCLGTAPQRTSIGDFLKKIAEMTLKWELLTEGERRRWTWIILIGEFILQPFGLYDARYDRKKNYIEPTKYFSLSPEHIDACIKPDNPSLDASEFYTCRPARPALIVNTNLIQDSSGCPQIPAQATPVCCGVPRPESGRHDQGRRKRRVLRLHRQSDGTRINARNREGRHRPALLPVRHRRMFQRLLRRMARRTRLLETRRDFERDGYPNRSS